MPITALDCRSPCGSAQLVAAVGWVFLNFLVSSFGLIDDGRHLAA